MSEKDKLNPQVKNDDALLSLEPASKNYQRKNFSDDESNGKPPSRTSSKGSNKSKNESNKSSTHSANSGKHDKREPKSK